MKIVEIRIAKGSDIEAYTRLLQKTYQKTYTNNKLGLTKNCFSRAVFATKASQDYLKSNLRQNTNQKTWLAFIDSKLVGSITITNKGDDCELKGFYVASEMQGKGIGKELFQRALRFARGKDIVLDLYVHNRKTIAMYKKWGFKIDKKKGIFYRHWPEWPEGLRAKCLYMRLSKWTSQQ